MTARVALTGPSTAFAAALEQTGIAFDRYDELAATDGTVRLVANDLAGQDRRTRKVNRWHLPWQDYSHWTTA